MASSEKLLQTPTLSNLDTFTTPTHCDLHCFEESHSPTREGATPVRLHWHLDSSSLYTRSSHRFSHLIIKTMNI